MTSTAALIFRALDPSEIAAVRAGRRPGPDGLADEVLELVRQGARGRWAPVSIEDTLDAVGAMSLEELLAALDEVCPDDEPSVAPLAQAHQVIRERVADHVRLGASVGGRRWS